MKGDIVVSYRIIRCSSGTHLNFMFPFLFSYSFDHN